MTHAAILLERLIGASIAAGSRDLGDFAVKQYPEAVEFLSTIAKYYDDADKCDVAAEDKKVPEA